MTNEEEMLEKALFFSVESYMKTVYFALSNNHWWDLRSSGYRQGVAAYVVNYKGTYYGVIVTYEYDVCFHPTHALSVLSIEYRDLKGGGKTARCYFQWFIINDNLAIAEIPVGRNINNCKTKNDVRWYFAKRINKIEEGK